MTKKLKAAAVSISVNTTLLISKIALAVLTNSIGLLAESAHSLFDLLASVLAWLGIKKAEKPDDHNHHYGHEKFETLSSFLQALLITGTAFIVMWEAYKKIQDPQPIVNSEWGMILMVLTIPVAYLTAKYLSNTAGNEGGSQALEADSAHFTTDILGSVAVLAGLVLARLGFAAGDPLAAFVVGAIMLYISIHLAKKAIWVFMDFCPPDDKMQLIEKILNKARTEERIIRYHKLRARMTGSKILLEFHIHVPKKLSIVEAHQIASDIKAELKQLVPEIKEATIHIEPD